jgi:CrcB protein
MPILLAIAVGGALGSLARYGIAEVMSPWATGPWPWATLLVNVVGAFVIGLVATSRRVDGGAAWIRPFIITGVLGGFTTVSALALETGVLIDTGRVLMGVGYFAATVVLGLLAVALAVRLGGQRA